MTLESLLNDAVRAHQAGDVSAAIQGYRLVLDQGGGAEVANLLSVALDQSGAAGEAEAVLETALASGAGNPEMALNLARLMIRRGAVAEALPALGRAIDGGNAEAAALGLAAAATVPDHALMINAGEALLRAGALAPDGWRQLVGALFATGRKACAESRATLALLLHPDLAAIAMLRAETAGALGAVSENRRQSARAAVLAPDDPAVQAAAALATAADGARTSALRIYHRALCLEPGSGERWNDYGALLKPAGDAATTARAFDRAVAASPRLVMALRNKGILLSDAKEHHRARAVYEQAMAIAPADIGLAFMHALTFPTIPAGEAEIAAIRAEIMSRMTELAARPERMADPMTEVGLPNFYLAYHGLNDREIQSRIADTYLALCPGLAEVAPHCRAPRPVKGRKLRVGFASRFFYDHSIRYSTAGILRNLDRSAFEVHVITDRPASETTLFRPGERADSHTVVPTDLARAREAIAALELDVLIYGDIGMEPLTFYLGFARLAPVQAHLQGHPVTPGIPNIDYFLTSAHQEPENCAEHYREVPVPFSGTLFCYEALPPVPDAMRSDFGLPEDGALYFCPQTLFKFHPSFDRILKGILSGDPDGWLVLLEDSHPARTRQLDARLSGSLGSDHARVLWMPRMAKQRYFQLVKLAAVMLDTTFFSGANTTLQSLGLGVPVVTLPGPYCRGRMTLGWLAEAGLMEMSAADPDDYVRIALRFGLDQEWRAEVVERIAAARPRLFEQTRVIGEFQDFLGQAHAAAVEGRAPIRWPVSG